MARTKRPPRTNHPRARARAYISASASTEPTAVIIRTEKGMMKSPNSRVSSKAKLRKEITERREFVNEKCKQELEEAKKNAYVRR